MALQLAFIIPWVLMALIVAYIIRRNQKSQKYEMDRRVARARVPVTWTPQWVSVLVALYFGAYCLYLYLDREVIMNVAMLFNVSAISYIHFYVLPKRKREFEARLRACHDRICPQCLFSLEGSPPDGI